MDDLTAFVTARLDEDEAAARAVAVLRHQVFDGTGLVTGPRGVGFIRSDVATWLADNDPARALREVAAKRAIVELHDRVHDCPVIVPTKDPSAFAGNLGYVSTEHIDEEDPDPDVTPCTTLRAVAAVWSDHPDYRPEWSVAAQGAPDMPREEAR